MFPEAKEETVLGAFIYNEYSATCYPNFQEDREYKIYQLSFMGK